MAGKDAHDRCTSEPEANQSELLLFIIALIVLEVTYFADALRPGWILSAADWLLASESYRTTGEPEYEPANRLLTDIACQMDPWMDLASRQWRAGQVPLWNPYAGCGAPLLANAQSGVFSPLNFIYFLTMSPYAWVAMAMAKLFVAGMGAYLLARELGLGQIGRWFAGLCFPFSGFVVVWLQYPMGSAAVWLPLVIWQVERLVRLPCAVRAGWLALVLSVVHLSGHPETTAHILLMASAVTCWRCFGGSPSHGGRFRCFGWFTASVLLSFLIAAVQLIPTAEYLAHSEAWRDRTAGRSGELQIRRPEILAMPALVAPYIYGSYLRGHPHVEKALGVENFNEIAGGYTGFITLGVLVPLAIRNRRRFEWLPFWIAVDALCLAVAYRLPLFDQVVRLIPVLGVAQNQRLVLVVSLAHCLFGAAALDCWSELMAAGAGRFRGWLACSLMVVAGLFAMAAVAVRFAGPAIERRAAAHFEAQARSRGLPDQAFEHRAREMARQAIQFFPRYYGGLTAYAVIFGFIVLRAAAPYAHRWPVGLLGICLVELFLFGRNYNPAIPIERYFPETEITRFLRDPPNDSAGHFRVLSLEEEFPPNVLGHYQIADLRNYDAIEVRRLLDLFEPLWPPEHGHRSSNAWTTWERIRANAELLHLANVRYVITTNMPPRGLATPLETFGRVMIQRLDGAGGLLMPVRMGVLDMSGADSVTTSIKRYTAGHIEARVHVPPGYDSLVFSEAYMPGWLARVDGERREVTPYRGAFNSVAISPGEHVVQFDYRPASFRMGLILSAAGMLIIVAIWSVAIHRRFHPHFHVHSFSFSSALVELRSSSPEIRDNQEQKPLNH